MLKFRQMRYQSHEKLNAFDAFHKEKTVFILEFPEGKSKANLFIFFIEDFTELLGKMYIG